MSRYIDADKLKEHASHYVRTQPHFHYGDWDNMCISGKEVDEIIDTCPTADVVEVVRCRDCAHYVDIDGFVYKGNNTKYCAWHSALRYADDYCSDGWKKAEKERSENGKS